MNIVGEAEDLRSYMQSMFNDGTVEQAWNIYNEKRMRYKEITGKEFQPE